MKAIPYFIKYSITIVLLLVNVCALYGQEVKLGIKGGLSLPNLSSSGGTEVSSGYETISGPDIALFGELRLSKNSSLECGLEWSTQGGQKKGVQAIPPIPEYAQYYPPNTEFLFATFTSTVRLRYLMQTIAYKYFFHIGNSERWKIYVDGGLFGALLINAEGSVKGSSKIYVDREQTQPLSSLVVQFDSTGSIKNELHQGNFGIEGNLGLLYQINNTSLFFETGGNYGFINLQKNNADGVNHTGAIVFRIGISIVVSRPLNKSR